MSSLRSFKPQLKLVEDILVKHHDLINEETRHKLVKLFDKYGTDQYMLGESTTQIEHAIRTWYILTKLTDRRNVQLAGLLHDVGHFVSSDEPIDPMETKVDDHHETVGADWLRKHDVPVDICSIVRNHVLAKRYLATQLSFYPDIFLSEPSRVTLKLQGSLMSPLEITMFCRQLYWQESVLLRVADDLSKFDTGYRI